MPQPLVGHIIGKGGSFVREVLSVTNVQASLASGAVASAAVAVVFALVGVRSLSRNLLRHLHYKAEECYSGVLLNKPRWDS